MKKFIQICKLPMLIASAAIIAIFSVLLIVGCTVPMGKVFSGVKELHDDGDVWFYNICYQIDFTSNEELEVKFEMFIDTQKSRAFLEQYYAENCPGEDVTEEIEEAMTSAANFYEHEENSAFYVKKDGKLYIDDTAKSVEEVEISDNTLYGEFAGSKILFVPDPSEEGVVLSGVTNNGVVVSSIVLLVVAALALAGSVTTIVLDKKGIIKQ